MKHWKLIVTSAYGKRGKDLDVFRDRTKFGPTPKRADARFRRGNAIRAGQNWRDDA